MPFNLSHLGFSISDMKNNIWKINQNVIECIKSKISVVGLKAGEVEKTTLKGTGDTAYIFNTSSKEHGDVAFRMIYYEDQKEMVVEIDAQHLKDDVQENLLDGFFWALHQCKKKAFPMHRQEKSKEPEEPPQKDLYGYAKKEDQDKLADAFSKMGIGKGRTRRSKKHRATQRRKTNLHNRRR